MGTVVLQSPQVAGARTVVLLSASQKTVPDGRHQVLKKPAEGKSPSVIHPQGPLRVRVEPLISHA